MTNQAPLSDYGEFRLLQEKVLPLFGRQSKLGDDCGWIELGGGKVLLATTDSLIEGSHYRKTWMSPSALARKALRVAASDIAAMGGGESISCLTALGMSRSTKAAEFEEFMKSLIKEARKWKIRILGGDLTEVIAEGNNAREFITLTVIAVSEKSRLLLRDQARPGETIWVTGPIGLSKAGLEFLEQKPIPPGFESLASTHLCPPLRLLEGTRLSVHNLSRAAMDLSDSLAYSLVWMARQSRVDFEVNLHQFPTPQKLSAWASLRGASMRDYLLYGSEDYELLFTSSSSARFIQGSIPDAYAIGRVVKGSGRVRITDIEGSELELNPDHLGYQAFGPEALRDEG